MQTQTQYYTNY